MAFGDSEVDGRVEAAEGGVLGSARVDLKQDLGLDENTVSRGGDKPLARGREPE